MTPTCWFCNRNPSDPKAAWTTNLRWTRPKSIPPPVDHDDTILATSDIKRLAIRLPRCPACRSRARLPVLQNLAGAAFGGAACLFAVALWAKLTRDGMPRIGGTWYPVAAVGTVVGAVLGAAAARPFHPKPTRRSWFDHPSLRLLAAEGWTRQGGR
jgi:hypothetical protein